MGETLINAPLRARSDGSRRERPKDIEASQHIVNRYGKLSSYEAEGTRVLESFLFNFVYVHILPHEVFYNS